MSGKFLLDPNYAAHPVTDTMAAIRAMFERHRAGDFSKVEVAARNHSETHRNSQRPPDLNRGNNENNPQIHIL